MFLSPLAETSQSKRWLHAPSGVLVGVLTVLCFLSCPGITAPAERYTGEITLPIDLFTQEGARIEKHKWGIEVASDVNQWTLSFLPPPDKKDRVIVKGNVARGDPFLLPAMTPLVGTHHMRSSSELLKTAQERQFSKTGLPQYAEQERSWKSTLRVYTSSTEVGAVFFVFHVRNSEGQLTRVDFKLRSEVLKERQ